MTPYATPTTPRYGHPTYNTGTPTVHVSEWSKK